MIACVLGLSSPACSLVPDHTLCLLMVQGEASPAHTVRPVLFWPYHFSSSVVGVADFPSCVVQAMVTNDLAFATQLRILSGGWGLQPPSYLKFNENCTTKA